MASSNAGQPHNFLEIVSDVIDTALIDNVVESLGKESATDGIYTQLEWTDACDHLLRTYREQIHPGVCPARKGRLSKADAIYRSSVIRRLPPS